MAAKKRSKARRSSSSAKSKKTKSASGSVQKRFNLAWSNFTMFIILFLVSFLLYNFSTSSLLINFFGILSLILGVLAFAFLIALIVLGIARSGKRKKRKK